MNYKIRSSLYVKGQIIEIDIYGYSTRSIPGLDIIGIGNKGKLLREKLNFLTNRYAQKIKALKRFVISIEGDYPEEKLKLISRDLEFPILILYWAMLGILPIKNLDNCWATGSINIDLEIFSPLIEKMDECAHRDLSLWSRTLICNHQAMNYSFKNIILWNDLFEKNHLNSECPSKEPGFSSPSI